MSTDRPSSRPLSPVQVLEAVAKELRTMGWRLLELASGVERALEMLRGEKP